MSKKELLAEIAKLESLNDHLMTELGSLDLLLREVGFSEGIDSVKAVLEDLLAQGEV